MEEHARQQPVIKEEISHVQNNRVITRGEDSRRRFLGAAPWFALGEGYSFRRLIAGRVHATRRGRRNDQAWNKRGFPHPLRHRLPYRRSFPPRWVCKCTFTWCNLLCESRSSHETLRTACEQKFVLLSVDSIIFSICSMTKRVMP